MYMKKILVAAGINRTIEAPALPRELSSEFLRKSIHMMVALVPTFANINIYITLALLAAGSIVYAYAETLRISGRQVFLVSRVTAAAAREQDQGRFVLGPLTLAFGAMLSLLLYPEPAAAIAIYALAFGDGISSIVGKLIGKVRIPFSGGKTFAGSTACFLAVLASTYAVTADVRISVIIAFGATFLESLPAGDMDNILLPVGTGLLAAALLGP
jgi:dolichol kinase